MQINLQKTLVYTLCPFGQHLSWNSLTVFAASPVSWLIVCNETSVWNVFRFILDISYAS